MNREPAGEYDAVIVGGGPSGSAIAALLARAGRRAAVFERDEFPRDKLCGEFLSPESQRLLAGIGCLEAILARGPARISRARFTTPSGAILDLDLPGEGLGLSRSVLDSVLLDHAAACGAEAFTGAEARAVRPSESAPLGARPLRIEVRLGSGLDRRVVEVSAGSAIGAHGRRGRLDRELARPFLGLDHPFAGLERHLRPRPGRDGEALGDEIRGAVEVHAFDGGYCGLMPVESGRINACMLLEERFLKPLRATRWEAVCDALGRANGTLARRLAALEPAEEPVRSVAGVPFTEKERAAWPLLFVGDAAGVIAPLCGDGQAMALESATLLAGILDRAPRVLDRETFDRTAREWDRAWRRAFAKRVRIGRWLQSALLRGRAADVVVWLGRRLPWLARWALGATRGR